MFDRGENERLRPAMAFIDVHTIHSLPSAASLTCSNNRVLGSDSKGLIELTNMIEVHKWRGFLGALDWSTFPSDDRNMQVAGMV